MQTSFDSRQYFFTPHHLVASDGLARVLEKKGSSVFVVTGESGTGKTTLLRQVVESNTDEKTFFVFFEDLNANFSKFIDVLNTALPAMQAEAGKALSNARGLKEKLLAMANADKKCVVIIDNAQNLSRELFGSLHRLVTIEQKNGISICLVGNEKLDTRLKMGENSQMSRLCRHRFYLPSMTLSEVKTFVKRQNPSATNLKASASLAMFWYSNGNPRILFDLYTCVMREALDDNTVLIDNALVDKAAQSLSLPTPDKPFPNESRTVKGLGKEFFDNLGAYAPQTSNGRARPKNNDPSLVLTELAQERKQYAEKQRRRSVSMRTHYWPLRSPKIMGVGAVVLGLFFISFVSLVSQDDSNETALYQRAVESKIIQNSEALEPSNGWVDDAFLSIYAGLSSTTNRWSRDVSLPSFAQQSFKDVSEYLYENKFRLETQNTLSSLDVLPPARWWEVRIKNSTAHVKQAQAYMAQDKLIYPSSSNAYMTFRKALIWNPNNADALAGIEQIQNVYVSRSREARAVQDWPKANRYFNIALDIGNLREIE